LAGRQEIEESSALKLLREPLLHFVLIGAAFFLLYGAFADSGSEQGDKRLVVTAAEVEWMRGNWQKRWGRAPTAQEFDGLIQQYIREHVLYREALALGLDRNDQIIRRRLAQKMEFIAKDLVSLTPPTDEDLLTYFETHQDRYRLPARYTFSQVFIDPDKRGDATLRDAEAIKARLIAEGDAIADPGALGDDFMLANYYPEKDPLEIQKLFGKGFAESLIALAPGQWHGPILSGYGTHLVYLRHVTESQMPPLDAVRERVVADWTTDRGEALKERFVGELLEQYSIVVEPTADGTDVSMAPEAAR
jgi:hypothetical protein